MAMPMTSSPLPTTSFSPYVRSFADRLIEVERRDWMLGRTGRMSGLGRVLVSPRVFYELIRDPGTVYLISTDPLRSHAFQLGRWLVEASILVDGEDMVFTDE